MSKHTPGPWAVHPLSAYVVPETTLPLASKDAIEEVAICAMHHPDSKRSEAEVRANAELLAAAPDPLEALEALLEAVKQVPAMNNQRYDALGVKVNNAISKARGGWH